MTWLGRLRLAGRVWLFKYVITVYPLIVVLASSALSTRSIKPLFSGLLTLAQLLHPVSVIVLVLDPKGTHSHVYDIRLT